MDRGKEFSAGTDACDIIDAGARPARLHNENLPVDCAECAGLPALIPKDASGLEHGEAALPVEADQTRRLAEEEAMIATALAVGVITRRFVRTRRSKRS